MKLIDTKNCTAFVKLEDGTKEVVTNCNASVTRMDELDPTFYLKLERSDSVSYFDLDRVVSFTFRLPS